jgi:hypothetical protein
MAPAAIGPSVLVEDHLPFVLQTAANLRSYLLSFAVIITLSYSVVRSVGKNIAGQKLD